MQTQMRFFVKSFIKREFDLVEHTITVNSISKIQNILSNINYNSGKSAFIEIKIHNLQKHM